MPSCMCAGVACVAQHEDVTSCSRTSYSMKNFACATARKAIPRACKIKKWTWHGVEDSLQGRARVGAANDRSVRSLALLHQVLAHGCVRAVGQRASVHEAPVAVLQAALRFTRDTAGASKLKAPAASGGLPGAPSARLRRCALPAHVRGGERSGKWQTKALLGGCTARTGTWLRPHIFNTPRSS